jgi:hypothetical protein
MSTTQPISSKSGFSGAMVTFLVLVTLGNVGFAVYSWMRPSGSKAEAAVFEVERLLDEQEQRAQQAVKSAEENLAAVIKLKQNYQEEVQRKTRQDSWRIRSNKESEDSSTPTPSGPQSK